MTNHLSLGSLGDLTLIDAGGTQGAVYAAPQLRMQYAQALVFKRYKAAAYASLDVSVLETMPAYLESLPFSQGMELLSLAAWPCRLVDEGSTVVGFVMPHIPAEFFTQMKKASGMSRERAEFQHLLNPENFLAHRKINLTDRHRYQLLREVAQALSVFHRHAIAVGDLSPKNLLYTIEPPGVYFVDCDSMRIKGRSALDQAETPGWEVRAVNQSEEKGTAASDSYKLGLLALRLLAGSQESHDPAHLPAAVPPAVRPLVTAALSADPARRPKPGDWISPLESAAATASTAPPQARQAAAPAQPAARSRTQGSATPAAPPTGQPARSPASTPRLPSANVPVRGSQMVAVARRGRDSRGRRAALASVIGVLVLGIGAAIGLHSKQGTTNIKVIPNPTRVTKVSVLPYQNLQVGMCLQLRQNQILPPYDVPRQWHVFPCSQPHNAEVFYDTVQRNATYSAQALKVIPNRMCVSRFPRYVGVSFSNSQLRYTDFYLWSSGGSRDLTIICLAGNNDGSTMYGTVWNSRQ